MIGGRGPINLQPSSTLLRDDLEEDSTEEVELPFYKKIKYTNTKDNPYAKFKAICIQEGLIQELTQMMSPMKPVATVSNAIKLMRQILSKSEIPILLHELENLPIFNGLQERAEKRFAAKKDSTINTQLDLAKEMISLQIKVMKCVRQLHFFEEI